VCDDCGSACATSVELKDVGGPLACDGGSEDGGLEFALAESRFWSKFGPGIVSLSLDSVNISAKQSVRLLSSCPLLKDLNISLVNGGTFALPSRLDRATGADLRVALSRLRRLTLILVRPILNIKLLLLSDGKRKSLPIIERLEHLKLIGPNQSDHYVRLIEGRRGFDRGVSVTLNMRHLKSRRVQKLISDRRHCFLGLDLYFFYPTRDLCNALLCQRGNLQELSVYFSTMNGNPLCGPGLTTFRDTILSLTKLKDLCLDAAVYSAGSDRKPRVDTELAVLGWLASERLPELKRVRLAGSSLYSAEAEVRGALPTPIAVQDDSNSCGEREDKLSSSSSSSSSQSSSSGRCLRRLEVSALSLLSIVVYMPGISSKLAHLVSLKLHALPDLNDHLFQVSSESLIWAS
jgi:Leucine Rich Repeat